jgi:hypothetical protein
MLFPDPEAAHHGYDFISGVEFDIQVKGSEVFFDPAVKRHYIASFRNGRLFSKKFTVSMTAKEMKRFTTTQKTAGPSLPICQ